MVREYWEYCGPIESLDIMTFPDTGRFKGIAFITFATEAAYESALEYDGTDCDGQILKVQKCKADRKKKRLSGAAEGGQTTAVAHAHQPTVVEQTIVQPPAAVETTTATPTSNASHAAKVPGYNVAYVGNIAFEASPDEIKALFEPYGVIKVRLHTDKDTGKPKGYAHVHFKDAEGLDKAVAINGTNFFGRNLRIGYAQQKKQN
jgi:nucleolin